jgi:hypothetical protein
VLLPGLMRGSQVEVAPFIFETSTIQGPVMYSTPSSAPRVFSEPQLTAAHSLFMWMLVLLYNQHKPRTDAKFVLLLM